MDSLITSVLASITPVLIGLGSTLFKPYIEPIDKFRDRVNLKRSSLIEKHASKNAALIKHALATYDTDDPLRGDGIQAPDLVFEVTNETFRLFKVFYRIELLKKIYKVCHFIMLLATVLGVVGLLLVFLLEPFRHVILIVASILIILQIVAVIIMFFNSTKFDTYEDII